jgi:hypothetical protein
MGCECTVVELQLVALPDADAPTWSPGVPPPASLTDGGKPTLENIELRCPAYNAYEEFRHSQLAASVREAIPGLDVSAPSSSPTVVRAVGLDASTALLR